MADPTTPNWGLPYPVNSDSVNAGATAIAALAEALDSILATVANTPIGFIGMYGSTSIPAADGSGVSRWMFCNGTAISRTTYSTLFSIIGSTFGAGDGSTTFNLPNMSGSVPVGVGTASATGATAMSIGGQGGEATHALQYAELAVHNHNVYDPTHAHSYSTGSYAGNLYFVNEGAYHNGIGPYNVDAGAVGSTTSYNGTGIGIENAGNGTGHNNMQPYTVLSFIIKVL